MANVQGILAAGDVGASANEAAQQPLKMMQNYQSIMNQQMQNKLYQQDLQQKQQANSIQRTNRMSQLLGGALAEDDDHIVGTSQRLLGQVTGDPNLNIDPQTAQTAQAIIGRGDPKEIR